VPALRALREGFPDREILLAAPAVLAPLAALSGAVDRTVAVAALAPLPPAVHGAHLAANLHGRGPQSHAVLRATSPQRLIAFGEAGVRWRADEHEVARWCRLLSESGIPADPSPDRLRLPIDPDPASAGATLLHPGAASPARRWPAERWAELARAERVEGRPVLLTGSAAERPLALAVARAAGLGDGAVRAGRTDLIGLAGLVAGAERVVSGDTGVSHLATAAGTPSVTLFGPVAPQEWGPPPLERHVALWAGRRGDPHGRVVDPGLLALGVEQVAAALAGLPVRAGFRPASR
jgi:ADP-heptose:LPS heptosyltransferase